LSLNYTADRLEIDLNSYQKAAILKSLEKWKGELPIDNKFTVTSITDLKSETADDSKVFKKKNKNTVNAKVVYMWAQTTNPNYDPKKLGGSELGDPKFIRTQFNVLLKQSKNGNWKAIIERDIEIKTESADIIENDEDIQIYKDLFATDNADNAFTATEEVLIEDANTMKAEPSKNISNTTTISSISSSQISIISSQIVPTISPIENLDLPVAKEKTSWLQNILSFGSVSANVQVAQQYNYSLPWKGGDKWWVTFGWHECDANGILNPNYNNPSFFGCALDITPSNAASDGSSNNTPNTLLAPITTTISRSCQDNFQGALTMGDILVAHIDRSSMNVQNDGALVRKGQPIGSMFVPPSNPLPDNIDNTSSPAQWKSACGGSNLNTFNHVHIKFNNKITIPPNRVGIPPYDKKNETLSGSFKIDGFNLQGPKILPLRADGMQNYNAVISGN
jgi:hypothetical protein